MPPKKTTNVKLEDLLKSEQRRLIEDHMGDSPCILCGNVHPEKDGKMHAWLCTQKADPISDLNWIGKNFRSRNDRINARTYIFHLQKLGSIPSRASEQPVAPLDDDVTSSQTLGSTESGEGQDAQVSPQTGGTEPAITQEEKDQELKAVDEKLKALEQDEAPVLAQHPFRSGSCATITDAVHTKVTTNFFKIDIDAKATFYEYQIGDLPIGQSKKKLDKLVRAMIDRMVILRDNKDYFATDHVSTIISFKKLHDQAEVGDIIGTCDVPDGRRDDTNVERKLSLKLLRVLDFAKLREYVGGNMENPSLWDSSVEVKALNLLISKSLLDKKVIRVGANKFFVVDKEEYLSPSLSTIQGYFYTIKPLDAGILLNVNYGTSAFYVSQTVESFLKDTETFLNEKSKWAALSALRVEIKYGRGKTSQDRERDWNDVEGRQKTISGTSKDTHLNELTFDKKATDGTVSKKNVLKYLQEAYPIVFKEEEGNLPGINLGTPRDKEWFAATTLAILPHQIYRRPVPDHLTDAMLKRASKIPEDSVSLIGKVFDFLAIKEVFGSDIIAFAGCERLTIVPELLQVASTIMRYPSIIYGENKHINLYNEYRGKEGFGETPRWTLNECRFLESGPTAGTGVQVFLLATSQVEALQTELKEALGKYNIGGSGKGAKCAVSYPPPLEDLNDAELRKALQFAKDTFTEGRKKVVVLLLPTPDRTVYQSFKDLTDREFGLQALCITAGKVFEEGTITLKTKGLDQYLGNVMMKINLKCEGVNHSAGDNVKNFKESLKDKLKDVMILGADVTHPSLVSIESCPSIAAIVGSIDDFGGKFLGSMRLQNPDRTDREIIQEVESMVVERLRAYWKYPVTPKNSIKSKERAKLPTRIMYYRDGVSEGQFSKVIRDEVRAIERAFETVKKEKKWKEKMQLTSLVVTKRHHTRFYPTSDVNSEGKPKNCKPGTVVDRSVTSPYFKEFFLQSHSGLQGTTKPAHYFVIQDDANWNVADLATFTHQLSYTYVRASCGVSYAPPAYYADRLCERGRIYLRSFLNGDADVIDEINNRKSELESQQRRIRDAIFKPTKEAEKTRTGVWPAKSKEEGDDGGAAQE